MVEVQDCHERDSHDLALPHSMARNLVRQLR